MKLAEIGNGPFFKGCARKSGMFIPGYISDNTLQATFYADPSNPVIYKIPMKLHVATKKEEQIISSNRDMPELLELVRPPGIFSSRFGEGIVIVPVEPILITADEYLRYGSGHGGTYQRDSVGDMCREDLLQILSGLFSQHDVERILTYYRELGVYDDDDEDDEDE